MSKKQDNFYFDNFITCADYACQAACFLEKIMANYELATLESKLGDIHEIEHSADSKKHELLNVLAKSFITPIEREDIIEISHNIDEVTDKLEDVLIRMYYNHITKIRPDTLNLVKVVIECCEELKALLVEFRNFKRSKTLRDHIIRINTLEEQADKLFIACMYDLHAPEGDLMDVIAWREVYFYLEKCADAVEHVADTVESVVMKNS